MSARVESPTDPPEDSASLDELHEAAAHGLRWSAISRPFAEVVQFASLVVLAHLVLPAEFGRFAIASIAQQIAYVIVVGGLSAALVQRDGIGRRHLETANLLGLGAGVALALVTLGLGVVAVGPIFGAHTASFVTQMAPLCLVAALGIVPTSVLQRSMKFKQLGLIEMLSTLSRCGSGVALAVAGLGGEAMVLGLLVGSVVATLMAWIWARPPLPRFDREAARELIDYALPTSLASVSWVGFSNVDYLIVGARLNPLETGYYFRAYTLAVEYQSKLSIVLTQVGFPVLSRARDEADLTRLSKLMVRVLTVTLFPLLVLLAVSAPVAVPFLFGPDWGAAIVPTQILALGGAATLVITAIGAMLMAIGRAHALLGYGLAHFFVYGIAAFFVVPFGITALAIAAAVVHTAFLFVAYAMLQRDSAESTLARMWDDLAPATVASIILAAVAVPASLLLNALALPAWLWLPAIAALSLPPYVVALRVGFPAAASEQLAVVQRVLPARFTRPAGDGHEIAAAARARRPDRRLSPR